MPISNSVKTAKSKIDSADIGAKPKTAARKQLVRPSSSAKSGPAKNPAPANKPKARQEPVTSVRSTKQELVLTMLSSPNGASIDEIMQATSWQQHSVRGFLAGTVKGKLGLDLVSSKAEGEARRYRIETQRRR